MPRQEICMSLGEAIEVLLNWQKARTVLYSRFTSPSSGNDPELWVMVSSVTTSELQTVDREYGKSSKPFSLEGATFAYSVWEGNYTLKIAFAGGSSLTLTQQPPLER